MIGYLRSLTSAITRTELYFVFVRHCNFQIVFIPYLHVGLNSHCSRLFHYSLFPLDIVTWTLWIQWLWKHYSRMTCAQSIEFSSFSTMFQELYCCGRRRHRRCHHHHRCHCHRRSCRPAIVVVIIILTLPVFVTNMSDICFSVWELNHN